jgi:MFS family permease
LLFLCVLIETRPVVGGFAAQHKGWRWTQWSLIFVTLAAFIIAAPMSETYKPIILKQRAKKYGIAPLKDPERPKLKSSFTQKIARPLHMLFTEVNYSDIATGPKSFS